MPIRVQCPCGRVAMAPDSAAGRVVKCPTCGKPVRIPGVAPNVSAARPAGPPPRVPPPGRTAGPPGPPMTAGPPIGFREAGLRPDDLLPADRRRRERQAERRRFSMARAFGRAFVFPLTGSGIIMAFLVPIGFVAAGFVPCVGWLLALGLYYGWIIQVIQGAATGPDTNLEWGDEPFWSGRVWPALKIVANAVVCLGVPVAVTLWWLGQAGHGEKPMTLLLQSTWLLAIWAAAAIYYPMSFTIVATYGAFLPSINPVLVFRSIFRVPGEYFLVWTFAVGMYFLPEFLLRLPLAVASPLGARFGWPFLSLYIVSVIVSRLGFLAYRNRDELGWG